MKSIKILRAFNLISFLALFVAGFIVLFFHPPDMMERYLAFANFAIKILLPSFVAGFGGSPLKKYLDNQAAKTNGGNGCDGGNSLQGVPG